MYQPFTTWYNDGTKVEIVNKLQLYSFIVHCVYRRVLVCIIYYVCSVQLILSLVYLIFSLTAAPLR